MKSKGHLFLLLLFLPALATAQIAIGYCPSLDSKEVPVVKAGPDFQVNGKLNCREYCAIGCTDGFIDPIGGYKIGYYLYKDKEKDCWQLYYRIGDDAVVIQELLRENAEGNKHKLQDKKDVFPVITVPLNPSLGAIEDDLRRILVASKDEFRALAAESQPFGKLGGLFSSFSSSPNEAKLTLTCMTLPSRKQAIFEVLDVMVRDLLPEFEPQANSDASTHYFRNAEFPTLELVNELGKGEVYLTVKAPTKKDPPTLRFDYGQLRPSRNGVDTLVTSKLVNGKNAYVIGFEDLSAVASFRLDKEALAIQSGENGLWVQIDARPDLNLKTVSLEATDEHGNQVTKRVFLLAHEADPPRIGLLNPVSNSYQVPGDEVTLDKFGNRFELRGKVADESPISAFRINGQNVELDENNLFSYGLKPSDNRKQMTLEAVDANGNRNKALKFTLFFKESGADRKMRQAVVDENFGTENKAHLSRNGQDGLQLKIRDSRYYLQRQMPIDSGASGGNGEPVSGLPARPHLAIAPFGFQAMDFNTDFELQVAFKRVEDEGGFVFSFGLNEEMDSYFFLYGEHGNFFLGQMENGKEQCLGEGCPQNVYGRVYASYPYLTRIQVKPNFFEQGTGVEYKLTIRRYNQFYIGGIDDPQDYLLVTIDNGIDKSEEMRFKLTGGNARIAGGRCGFGLEDGTHLAVSKFTFKNGDAATKPAFFEDKEIEKFCMPGCFKVDSTKHMAFLNCLADDYHALIVANGEFGGRHNALDSAVQRGRQLRDQLINNYQFPAQQVTLLENAKKQDFETKINQYYPSHLTGKDRLLIYIISHGTPDKQIAFQDADFSTNYLWSLLAEKKGDQTDKYKCKQVLVAIDACFSGEMVPSKQTETNPNREVCDAFGETSRLVLTSASNSPTRDSELTKAIISHLLRYPNRFLTIDKLFELAGDDFGKAMQGIAKPTLTIFQPGVHQPNGSFLFVKKKFYQ